MRLREGETRGPWDGDGGDEGRAMGVAAAEFGAEHVRGYVVMIW